MTTTCAPGNVLPSTSSSVDVYENRLIYPVSVDTPDRLSEREASVLAREFLRNRTPFPFFAYFTHNVPEMVRNAREYVPNWEADRRVAEEHHRQFVELYYGRKRKTAGDDGQNAACGTAKPFHADSGMFRGRVAHLLIERGLWDKINVLVQVFAEDQQILGRKRYNRLSLQNAWKSQSQLTRVIAKASENGRIDAPTLREAMYMLRAAPELTVYGVAKARAITQLVLDDQWKNERPEALVGKSWLDISAGWGDRLAAARTLDMHYLGFDPNVKLKRAHDALVRHIASSRERLPGSVFDAASGIDNATGQQQGAASEKSDTRVVYTGFETAAADDEIRAFTEKHGAFDIVHTSPPFFTLELYPGANQSTEKHSRFDDWLHNWLFESLRRAWSALRSDGYMCINIEDVGDGAIVGPMNDFIGKLPNAKWVGPVSFSSVRGRMSYVYVWKKK